MKKLVRNVIINVNENWFSFISGVLACIPITLLLNFEKIEEGVQNLVFFILLILTFLSSLFSVYYAFHFTIKKTEIDSIVQDEYDKWILKNQLKSAPNKKRSILEEICERKDIYIGIRRNIVKFFLSFIITFLLIIALWIMKNIS